MSAALLEHKPVAEANGEITPEQLLEMPEGDHYELIDGKLVERHMGAKSNRVAVRVSRFLDEHAQTHGQGHVFSSDCGYRCFDWKPLQVRKPDVSVVVPGRLKDEEIPVGYILIYPDLAVEVVSKNDLADEIEGRRVDFMRAGTRLLWVIYPEFRTVHVFRKDGSALALGENGELGGEDVLPGFACKVAALFEGL